MIDCLGRFEKISDKPDDQSRTAVSLPTDMIMTYTILCAFRPGGLAEAGPLRLSHYEFLRRVRHRIIEGGPLLGPDGHPTHMLMVIEAENAGSARDFIHEEPYNRAGLFESVSIRKWSHVLPEPSENYLENEYRKEVLAHGKSPD